MNNHLGALAQDNDINLHMALQKINLHLENIPMAIIEWDKEARVAYWSGQAEKILGWKAEEVLGKYIFDIPFILEEELPKIDQITNQIFHHGLTYLHSVNRNYTKDKKVIYCEWYNSVLKDSNGVPSSVYSFFYDVTEQKETEKKLVDLKEHFDLLMKATNDSFWEYDIHTKKVVWNENICRLYGISSTDELNQAMWASRVHPEDLPVVAAAFSETLRHQIEIWITEYRFRQQDNSYKYYMDRGYVQYSETGEPVKVIGTTVDVTLRKEAEEKLKKSNERVQLMSKATNDGIWDYDMVNKEVWWNGHVYQMFGFDKNQKPNIDVWIAKIHPDDRPLIYESYHNALKEGNSTWTNEYRMLLADGRYHNILDRCYLVYDEQGKPCRLMGATMDISAQKENEKKLQQANRQLRDLSSYLQQIREQERTTIARELHDELGQQLTALRMEFASLIKKCEGVSVKFEDRIANIFALMDEMGASIRHISSELRPSMLDDLGLQEAIAWQQNEFEKRSGIKCHLFSSGDLSVIPAKTATALFRILQESLTNIGRHSQATEVNTELIMDNQTVYLNVHDNGRGFDIHSIDRKRSFGLLGIQERATSLAGQLHLTSTPGQGTQLHVTIPL